MTTATHDPQEQPIDRTSDAAFRSATFFHTPRGEAYGSVPNGLTWTAMPVRSGSFRKWLVRLVYREYKCPPKKSELAEALDTVEAAALYDGPEARVFLRVGRVGDEVYLDTGDVEGHWIHVTGDGWKVCTGKAPIHFIRPGGLRPAFLPTRGGTPSDVTGLLGRGGEGAAPLKFAVLAAHLAGVTPSPILTLHGGQGSGKSLEMRVLGDFIDPCHPTLVAPPSTERNLAVEARSRYLVRIDNASEIDPKLADALCRLSTGAGFTTRRLYTNADLEVFDDIRPVMLNGIGDVTERLDLLDRCLVFRLPELDDSRRESEEQVLARFRDTAPRVLGLLLDGVVAGLRGRTTVQLPRVPRMADFARFAAAASTVLGVEPVEFLRLYEANREDATAGVLQLSPIIDSVLGLMRDRDAWSGTATSLLDDLSRVTPPAARAALPKTQTWVVRHVHRLEPALRRLGLVVSDGPRTSDTRTIQITRVRASGRGVGGPTPSTGSDPTEGAIARSTVAPACDPVDVGDGSDANDGKLAENS